MSNFVAIASLIFGISTLSGTAQEIKVDELNQKQLLVRKSSGCAQDLGSLSNSLLDNLPDYGNRIIQRTQTAHRSLDINNYIVVAGQREQQDLDLPQFQYNQVQNKNVKQVFFTTLERQYQGEKVRERETYHWLFLTVVNDQWRMVTMFSRFGSANSINIPSPPQDSSQGIIGQAVKLWLRDCNASSS